MWLMQSLFLDVERIFHVVECPFHVVEYKFHVEDYSMQCGPSYYASRNITLCTPTFYIMHRDVWLESSRRLVSNLTMFSIIPCGDTN